MKLYKIIVNDKIYAVNASSEAQAEWILNNFLSQEKEMLKGQRKKCRKCTKKNYCKNVIPA